MSHVAGDPISRLAADPDDRVAWAIAVEAYGSLCWRIALRMLRDESAAADAVQDSLLALRSSARRFRAGSDPAGAAVAWVARIVVNTCHVYHRRSRPSGALPNDLATAISAATDPETIEHLHAAITELPVGQREAVELRYLAELDYPQVATVLGVAEGAVRGRVHRALVSLQAILERRGVTLSAVTVAGLCEALAHSPVPGPAAEVVAGWSQAALLPVATNVSTGALIAMSSIFVAAGLAFTLTLAEQTPPAPLPPAPVPAPAPAPDQPRIDSVDAALRWLAEQQQPDGSWTPVIGAAGTDDERMLATGLAMEAFLGAGYDGSAPSAYHDRVARALTWLSGHPPTVNTPLPARAWRATAIAHNCEMSWDVTSDPSTKLVEATVTDLLAQRVGAGWPSRVGGTEIDARMTAYGIMAVRSANSCGLEILTARPLHEASVWADAAWSKRKGSGFPARTTVSGEGVGAAEDDRAGAVAKHYSDRTDPRLDRTGFDMSQHAAVLPLASAINPGDEASVFLYMHVAFLNGGKPWLAAIQHVDRMRGLVDQRATQGDVCGMAYLLLALEVHYRTAQAQDRAH